MVTAHAELEKGASFLPCSVNRWCIYDNDSSSSDIKLWLMGYFTVESILNTKIHIHDINMKRFEHDV